LPPLDRRRDEPPDERELPPDDLPLLREPDERDDEPPELERLRELDEPDPERDDELREPDERDELRDDEPLPERDDDLREDDPPERELLDRELLLREPDEPDDRDELRDDERREVLRSSFGISSCATAFTSTGICFARNLNIRSSSRRIDFASLEVSLSPTASASASIAV
jgi:hypothetical protein